MIAPISSSLATSRRAEADLRALGERRLGELLPLVLARYGEKIGPKPAKPGPAPSKSHAPDR